MPHPDFRAPAPAAPAGLDADRDALLASLAPHCHYPRECPETCCPHIGSVTHHGHGYDVFYSPHGLLGPSLKVQFGPEPREYSYWPLSIPVGEPNCGDAIGIGRLVHDYLKKE